MSELRKKQEYKELRPVGTYDVAALESWLEERAREGYRLIRFKGLYGLFHWEGAAPCRYRLQPLLREEGRPKREMMETYQEMGWEYVCTLAGTFHVWQCDDPTAPELDTDPVVQGMGYGYLRRKMRLRLLRLPGILLLLVVIFLYPWIWGAGDTPLINQLRRALPGEWILLVIVLGYGLFLEVLDVRQMRRLLRSLNAGMPLKRPCPWKLKKYVTQSVKILSIVIYVAVYFLHSGTSLRFTTPAMEEGGQAVLPEVVYADLRELDGLEELRSFSAEGKSLWLAPQMYWTHQSTCLPDGRWMFASTDYYCMRTEKLAERVEEELLYTLKRYGSEDRVAQMEVPGLDDFWWSAGRGDFTGEDGFQCVVARRENCALLLTYTGQTDLRTQGDYFAGLLAEK